MPEIISCSDIDQAVDLVERSSPPDAPIEVYDHNTQKLEKILDSCISNEWHLEHLAVKKRLAEKEKKLDRETTHNFLSRSSLIHTVKDLRRMIDGLPDEMPLICTGKNGNRKGLVFYSNEWAFQTAPGMPTDIHEVKYSARIYGIPEVDWTEDRLKEKQKAGTI